VSRIQGALRREGYAVSAKVGGRGAVRSAFMDFPGLLAELALSPRREEKLSVKLEVDTRPPAGAGLTVTLVRRHVTLRLQHHDKPTLLAGKLHALLSRPYAKGRDVYDLLWYLADPAWPEPNLVMLNNALAQTGWRGKDLEAATWRAAVAERLDSLDWNSVRRDVHPFLERAEEADLLTHANLQRVL
jgi:hypothetical protein